MAVIGGDQDQRIGGVGGFESGRHRRIQGNGIGQCAVGVAEVMAVIDAPGLRDQEEALWIRGKRLNGESGHFCQRGFALTGCNPVGLELHVRGFEQPQHLPARNRVEGGELGAVPDIVAFCAPLQPLCDQVPAIGAQARRLCVFRIRLLPGQEMRPAAAEDDVDTVAARELDELAGDVHAARGQGFPGHGRIVLPVPVR